METTRYFREQVLRKRPYLRTSWLKQAVKKPIYSEKQLDGRIKYWIYIAKEKKYLRVVILEDGKTVHNAFFDRSFKMKEHKI